MAVSVTSPASNSLAEQLRLLNLTQEQLMQLVIGFNNAMTAKSDIINIPITNSDGSITNITVPSNSFIHSELQKILESQKLFTDAVNNNHAYIIDTNGGYRKIISSSFSQSVTSNVSALSYSNEVSLHYSDLIRQLIYPTTKLQFLLPTDLKFVNSVNVKIFNLSNQTDFDQFNDGMELVEVIEILNANTISYEESNSILDTDIKKIKYYGNFDVLLVKPNSSNDGTIDVQLFELTYSDSDSIRLTRELAANDYLIDKTGNTKYKINYITKSSKTLNLTRVQGTGMIDPGVGSLSFFDPIFDDTRYISIPIKGTDKILLFLSPVHPSTNIASAWSTLYKVNADDLYIYDNGIKVKFNEFFSNKVLNIGEYLKGLINDSTISMSTGVKPDKPLLKSEFFQVVQTNKYLTENADIKKLSQLNTQKVSTFNQLNGINEQIAEIQKRIIQGNYKSEKDKQSDTKELNSLIEQKTKISSLFASLVSDINAKLSIDSIGSLTPTFSVRGFWPIQSPIQTEATREQHIIKYLVYYRRMNVSGNTSDSTRYKFIDENNSEKIGSFSDWQICPTSMLKKIQGLDESWQWETSSAENADEININQLDIPIYPGEKIQIRIKALSEAGYPISFTESDWSDIVDVVFPSEMMGITDLQKALEQNTEDMRRVELMNLLATEGITRHIQNSYSEQSNYFGHTSHEIASGFYNPTTQASITLFQYLQQLTAQFEAVQGKVQRQVMKPIISIGDGNSFQAITNFSTTQLFAGHYTENLDLTDPSNFGKILEKTFYIKISNPHAEELSIFSIHPGNLESHDEYAQYAFAPLSVPGIVGPYHQKMGQFIYNRTQDLAGTTSIYVTNFTPSSGIVPTASIESGATDEQKTTLYFDGTNIQRVGINKGFSSDGWVALHKNSPVAKDWLANPSTPNTTALKNELLRIQNTNSVLKQHNVLYAWNTNFATEFIPDDTFMVGPTSTGARLFVRSITPNHLQVNGSSAASFKAVQPGESNALLIPIIFQWRMTDANGFIDGGIGQSINDNFFYTKTIGFDMLLGNDERWKFDIQVSASFRPTTLSNTDVSVSLLNNLMNQIQNNSTITPKII